MELMGDAYCPKCLCVQECVIVRRGYRTAWYCVVCDQLADEDWDDQRYVDIDA